MWSVLRFSALVSPILWKPVIWLLLQFDWLVAMRCQIWMWGNLEQITDSLRIWLWEPDLDNLHNLIHSDDDSDTNTLFDDSSVTDSENSQNCETTPSSSVQGNEAELGDDRLKGKFVSKNVIDLSKQNLTENEISLLLKHLNLIST